MRIYKLDWDLAYQSLWPLTDADHSIILGLDGRPWGAAWVPMKVERYSGPEARRNRKLGDFPALRLVAPVFSRRAVEGLWDLLEPNGEILPLLFDEADYFVYNVTTLSDALDEERSVIARYRSGKVMEVQQFVFQPDRLGQAAIFKLTQAPRETPLVTEEFVQRVKELGLTGFEFKLRWEG